MKKQYTAPSMEVLEIEVESFIAMSGSGRFSGREGTSDFERDLNYQEGENTEVSGWGDIF